MTKEKEQVTATLRVHEFEGSRPHSSGKRYQWSKWPDDPEFVLAHKFGTGERLLSGWRPPKTIRMLEKHWKPKPMPDFVRHSSSVSLLSRRAADLLHPLINRDVELLPVDAAFGEYLAVNVLTQIKSLDVKRSTGPRADDGSIFVVHDHVFDPLPIVQSGAMVFRDASRTVPAYCRHEVIDLAVKHGLTGFANPKYPLWQCPMPFG